jgi:flagellar assembly protein FliH
MLEANSQIASYLKENKKNILAIGISIAEKVLRQKFEDEEAMDSLVLDVIKEYELKENFVIRVNSIYKESLDKQIIELKESKHIEKDVFILADETIEKGNALIESVNGRLIIGIDDVLTKVKEELL